MAGTGNTSVRSYNFFVETTIQGAGTYAENQQDFVDVDDNTPFVSQGVLFVNDGASELTFRVSADASGGPAAATGLLTVTTLPVDNDTVQIDGVTYRFKNTLAVANDVQIDGGSSIPNTISNLDAAIDLSGTPGTEYFTGTVAVTTVTGVPAVGSLTISAVTQGVGGNSLSTTTPIGAYGTWSGNTMAGGIDAGPSHGSVKAGETLQLDFRRNRRVFIAGAPALAYRFWAW